MPLISVVLPVYNVEAYIYDAVVSILNQNIQDFEIIVIDDCSTDNTVFIIENFKDARIRIIKKDTNKGLIDSLNTGFKEAKGAYIARMDGDDINTANRFEKQLQILQNNPKVKACGCWLQCFGVSTNIIKHKEFHHEIQAQLLLANPMSLGATMLEKEAYKNYGFDMAKTHAEDYDFWARTAWDCDMYNIQEVLYNYRTHKTQVSSLHNTIQKKQDINIKLSLYHKIDYDKAVFNDAFIEKVLFSNKSVTVNECVLFFKWIKALIKINKEQGIFDTDALLEILEILKRQFVFELFFTNNRKGMDFKLRKEILVALPIREKFFVVLKKVKERVSFLKK